MGSPKATKYRKSAEIALKIETRAAKYSSEGFFKKTYHLLISVRKKPGFDLLPCNSL